jgi:hypothetical protein
MNLELDWELIYRRKSAPCLYLLEVDRSIGVDAAVEYLQKRKSINSMRIGSYWMISLLVVFIIGYTMGVMLK